MPERGLIEGNPATYSSNPARHIPHSEAARTSNSSQQACPSPSILAHLILLPQPIRLRRSNSYQATEAPLYSAH